MKWQRKRYKKGNVPKISEKKEGELKINNRSNDNSIKERMRGEN